MKNSKRYWLLKSEPSSFSINDLASCQKQTTAWEGVRNYQARNLLRDEIKAGDFAFFYHSSCKVPGIVGIVEVVRSGYPDETALDVQSQYYDAKSTFENVIWFKVDVKLVEIFPAIITLQQLKSDSMLQTMKLLQKGNRLSVLPVSQQQWTIILRKK